MIRNRHFLVVVPAVALAMFACSVSIAEQAGTPSRSRGPQMNYQRPPVTDINEILGSKNPVAFDTRAVQLTNVKVQKVLSGQFILIGAEPDRLLAVRLAEPKAEIKPNTFVDVSGIVTQLGRDLSQWNLKPEDQTTLSSHQVFVHANEVKLR